jgi:hypothetical protein
MIPIEDRLTPVKAKYLHIMVDGKIVGFISDAEAQIFVDKLRNMKIRKDEPRVSDRTEIAYVPTPSGSSPGQFPGIFIFTGAARMMRPGDKKAVSKNQLYPEVYNYFKNSSFQHGCEGSGIYWNF